MRQVNQRRLIDRCIFLVVLLAAMSNRASAQAFPWVKKLPGEITTSVSASADADEIFVAGFARPKEAAEVTRGVLRKYNADGKLDWMRHLESDLNYFPQAVSADRSGVYVAGCTRPVSADETDAFVLKFDANGVENPHWRLNLKIPGSDCVTDIFADASGVYLIGYTSGSLPGQKPTGGWHVFVQRYGHDMSEKWTSQFAVTPPGDTATHIPLALVWSKPSIAVDSFGVSVAGYIQAQDGRNGLVRRYDLNGHELWSRRFGQGGSEYPTGVSADPSGVYVAGTSAILANGRRYLFLRKFAANGQQIWASEFSGPSAAASEIPRVALSTDPLGVYLAGIASETAGLRPFMRALDPTGAELWQQRLKSGSVVLHPVAISAHWRAVYVTGIYFRKRRICRKIRCARNCVDRLSGLRRQAGA